MILKCWKSFGDEFNINIESNNENVYQFGFEGGVFKYLYK